MNRYLVALQEYEGQVGCDQKRTAFLTLKVGEYVRDSGKLKDAIPFFHKALQLRQKMFGEESGEVAQTINEIGRLYYRLGRNRETLEMWERSLAIREGLDKRNEGDVGVALNNLGLIYHRLGRLRESEEAYQKCKGPFLPFSSALVINFSQICFLFFFSRVAALRIFESISHKDPDISVTYHNLGLLYSGQPSQLKKAEEMYLKGLIESFHSILSKQRTFPI